MDSSARVTIDLPVVPGVAQKAIERVIAEQKHTLQPSSGAVGVIQFITKKTMLAWELFGEASVSATPTGSRVDVVLDTAPSRPKAMLDGKKNAKAAQKLADQIRAAV